MEGMDEDGCEAGLRWMKTVVEMDEDGLLRGICRCGGDG